MLVRPCRKWYKVLGCGYRDLQVAGGYPPAIFVSEGDLLKELSIFVDESGGQGGHSKYCLMTLVLHDQSNPIDGNLEKYVQSLSVSNLEDIPFHAGPLMNGHGDYENYDLATRKKLFSHFFVFAKSMPFFYKTFTCKRSEVSETEIFVARLRKDLAGFLSDNLGFFQGYDKIKIYYDDGQRMVSRALHRAIDYILSKEAVMYREAHPGDYRLSQIADFVCALELIAIKFENGETTATDEKMFGTSYPYFKRNYLRQIRRKRMT